MRRRLLVPGLCVLLAAGGCAEGGAGSGPGDHGWRELAGSPLSARRDATGLWTGREVLLLGGADDEPCPVNADCPVDPTPRFDGAAVDPDSGRWRRIADSPVALLSPAGAVLAGTAYLLPGPAGERPAPRDMLTYDIEGDRWGRIPTPFRTDAGYALLAAGDRLIAYATSHETDPGGDFAFDPATRAWRRLPADPLGRSFDRAMAWTGRQAILFGKELIANPGAERPSVTRAAALEATGRWRRLPDSEILTTAPWLADGDRLINPTLGGADGGQEGDYGRIYPYGGVLDTATRRWAALPDAPALDPPAEYRAGAFGATAAVYGDADGAVLDVAAGRWLSIPAAPGGEVTGRTVVAAGTALLVFGGVSWSRRQEGTPRDDAWLWSPPA